MASSIAVSRLSGRLFFADTCGHCKQASPVGKSVPGRNRRLSLSAKAKRTAEEGSQLLSGCRDSSFLGRRSSLQVGESASFSPVCRDIKSSSFLGRRSTLQACRSEKKRRASVQCRAGSNDGGSFDLSVEPASSNTFGSRIETDQLAPRLRDSTMRAVDELGLRVTVGDVASKAGVKVAEAERALKALAADANGFLEVSDEGDVLFCFPRDYRSVLQQKSFKMRAEPFLRKAEEIGSYLVRVSFGTTLLASIVLVYTTIVALASSSSSSDRDNRNSRSGYGYGGGGYYRRGPGLYFDLSDILWYWDFNYYRRRRQMGGAKDGMNFFESVFSFVFGDGDPNAGREEDRWRIVGDFISQKGGVVTAEELAPFLDPPPLDERGRGSDDESFVLPALQRFDGTPEVDEQGNLLYRFPALQRTANDRKRPFFSNPFKGQDENEGPPAVFKERTWGFSAAPESQKALAIGLGLANLVGVVVLSTMLSNVVRRNPQLARELGVGLIGFVQKALPFLQGYAASFFAIPAFRWFSNQRKNAKIESRNNARLSRAIQLKQPDAQLKRKMLNARDQAQKVVISKDKVIYSTERDLAEQDIEADDWMQRLSQREEDRSR